VPSGSFVAQAKNALERDASLVLGARRTPLADATSQLDGAKVQVPRALLEGKTKERRCNV
jgi:hypothetical protein